MEVLHLEASTERNPPLLVVTAKGHLCTVMSGH